MGTQPNKLFLMCMDARMNVIADSLNDGKSIFIRNAAGNPYSAIPTLDEVISNYPIKQIIFIPHTDCGACKFTYSLLTKGESSTTEIEDGLVSTIRSNIQDIKLFNSSQDIIELLQKLGTTFLKTRYPELKISTELAKTNNVVTGEKHMLLLQPSTEKYSTLCDKLGLPLNSTYVSQRNNVSSSTCDVQLAGSALGIRNFTIMSNTNNTFQEEHDSKIIKEAVGNVYPVKITNAGMKPNLKTKPNLKKVF